MFWALEFVSKGTKYVFRYNIRCAWGANGALKGGVHNNARTTGVQVAERIVFWAESIIFICCYSTKHLGQDPSQTPASCWSNRHVRICIKHLKDNEQNNYMLLLIGAFHRVI